MMAFENSGKSSPHDKEIQDMSDNH